MDDIDYKAKMIYRHRIMTALCPVGAFLSTTHHMLDHYYWSLQEIRPSTRSAGMSIPGFIISLILIYTLYMLSNQNHEFVFEVFVFIIGAAISLSLTTVRDGYITYKIRDELLRDRYYISLLIWVIISYIFLFGYWIGMRKVLGEPLQIESRLVQFMIVLTIFLPVLLIVVYDIIKVQL
jgi:hypothetical protein